MRLASGISAQREDMFFFSEKKKTDPSHFPASLSRVSRSSQEKLTDENLSGSISGVATDVAGQED